MADDVEAAFRAALEKDAGAVNPAGPVDMPAPPRKPATVDPMAPHGRDENGEPLVPFGLNKKTGIPNLRRPGKPPKDEKPRVEAPPPVPVQKKDYSAALSDLTDSTWMLLSSAPVPVSSLKTRIQAQAALLNGNKPGIVTGLNLLAQNNGTFGRGVDMLTSGGASWMLPAMFALGPFVAQSVQMWRSEAADIEDLAAKNEAAWDATVKAMLDQQAEPEQEVLPA